MSDQTLSSYTTRRVTTALTPLARLQQAPYCGPVESFSVDTEDGVAIAGTRLGRRGRSALVICHGFGSHQRSAEIVWLAEHLAGPHDVLTFDWRGYGASGGAATLGGAEILDLSAVVGWARNQGYGQVGVIGDSMGGLITLWTQANLHLADAVATIGAPACYTRVAWSRRMLLEHIAPQPWASQLAPMLFGFRMGRLDPPRPLEIVNQINAPMLLLHGSDDDTVPVENAHALQAAAPAANLHVYPGAGHAIIALRKRYASAMLKALRTHFAGA